MVVNGWTGAFWDMDDFPLPPGLDVDQFVKNVELALWDKGVRGGDVVFYAYGSSDSFDCGRYIASESFTPEKVVHKPTRFYRLLHGMIHWLRYREQYGGIKTLLVIAKSIPGEDTKVMIRFFDRLLLRDHNVFTVVPDGCSPENCDYPEPIAAWHWSSLCSGGSSIDLYSSDDDDDSGSSSPETDRASETDAAGSATQNVVQKETADADAQN